jgi:hypothetical protein
MKSNKTKNDSRRAVKSDEFIHDRGRGPEIKGRGLRCTMCLTMPSSAGLPSALPSGLISVLAKLRLLLTTFENARLKS